MTLTEAEEAAYVALLEGSSLLFQAVDAQLQRDANVTQPQFEILARLSIHPEGLRMTDLAARVLLSRSGLTYQVAQMEKLGLLSRSRGDDERSILAKLTPHGEDLFNRMLPDHLALVRRSLFDLLNPGEAEMIASALGRVAAALRQP